MTATDAVPSLTPAGERLLEAAGELFYSRGIRAVGVDLIAEVAGTTKKTLYDRFGSKSGLVVLYLQRRQRRWQDFVAGHLEESDASGAARGQPGPESDGASRRPLAVLDALERWMSEQYRGCAFVNAYAELGDSAHPGLEVIRAEKQWTHDLYRRLCEESGFADPDAVAARLHLVHEGVLVLATVAARPDAFARGRLAAGELLDAAERVGPRR
jgi:AcrR family transcriptional regulator